MRRATSFAALAAALAFAAAASADEHDAAAVARADEHDAAAPAPRAPGELRPLLSAQRAAAARAFGQVEAKRVDAERIRAARARAAYKLLRGAGSPLAVTPERRMAVARSRATARLLLARDRAEVAALAEESGLLDGAVARLDRDLAAAATVAAPAPGSLLRPADGPIVRRFGTLIHEPTRTTLARRGVDLEVEAAASVVAPAAATVRYAGPIRGLDHGVILDAGGTILVIAKLAPPTPDLARSLVPGASVARGAALGNPARRRVYLEVRLPIGPGGTPVDPEPLLAADP